MSVTLMYVKMFFPDNFEICQCVDDVNSVAKTNVFASHGTDVWEESFRRFDGYWLD